MKTNSLLAVMGGVVMASTLAASAGEAGTIAAPAPAKAETTVPAPAAKVKKPLDKADALAVMNLQYSVMLAELRLVNTVQRRNDLIELLRLKYLNEGERNAFLFDVGTLKFFPKADIEKAQQAAADSKTEFKMPPGIKIIDVSKDDALVFANMALAIEAGRNDLNQLYARRNDLVKALLAKNGFGAEGTDIDVLNGNFIENAKAGTKK